MPITLITGPANAGKAQMVMQAVARHLAHGREPLLVVPTRADVEHYLRELAAERAVMGVRLERFTGLIEEAVRRAGVRERVIGRLARERLLEELLARLSGARPGVGYIRALSDFLEDLEARRIDPPSLARGLEMWQAVDGPAASGAELGRLFAAYREELRRLGCLDSEQRAVRALDGLRRNPALWRQTPVLFYGFDDLTHLQLDAIETLGRVVGAEVTVALAYEPGRVAFAGRSASFHALAPLASEHRQLPARAEHYSPPSRRALSHLEHSLFEPGARREQPGPAVRLLEGGGERAELELVAREIDALLQQGMAAEEVAVLARGASISFDLLEEVFAASGIPFRLERRRRLADTATGGALIGLLRCVPDPDGGAAGEVGDLLAWLRAPGLLERPGLADQLEISARRSGAQESARARELWEERNWPLERIERLREGQARGAATLCERAARELDWLFCAPRRGSATVLAQDELDEAAALAAGRRALTELRELARSAPQLAPASASELALALERIEFLSQSGPRTGAVAVLDPLALRARRVRALFVCGLQEGAFPARARPQPLLTEDERRRLAELSGLALGAAQEALASERYLLYASVSRPQERLILSWHLADDDGEPSSRSLFVDDICDLFDESLSRTRARRSLGAVDALPAPARCASAATREPLRDQHLLAQLRAHVWSASSLERWTACPTAWFVERLLRPGAFEPDAEPLARGGLAHAALKDTLEGLRLKTGSARLSRVSLGLARRLLAQALIDNEPEHPLSVAPERRAAVRRRLHADLERYLSHAAECESELEPSQLELGFGFDEGDDGGQPSGLPVLELPGAVKLRGRIDRVDVGRGGDAVVYDYKGARASPGARWIKDGSLQVALYMHAVERLLGLRAVGGFYQPLAGEDLRARGVLDRDSGVELDCVAPDVRGHEELQELLAQVLAAAREAADEAGQGRLEPRPATCAFRGGCMYPAICKCEL